MMQIKTFMRPGSKILAPLLLVAVMCSMAQGGVILAVTSGTTVDASGPEVVGQSFLTPGGGPWTNITFNFFSDVPASTPLAAGNAFLLTQEYLGPLAGLSSSTTGFLAESTGISGGKYLFDPTLILNANTEYWVYVDTAITTTGSSTGQTPAQQSYFINPLNDDFCSCNQSLTNFELDGSIVPEPGTWLTGLGGLAILAFLKVKSQNSTRRGKS